jgi:tetratricopeptide (TPR) repeat protein
LTSSKTDGPEVPTFRRSGGFACLMGVVFLMAILPESVHAHGDLEIRIAEATGKIEAATNNPAQLYLDRGELHREHRSWTEAEADYARAAELDPELDGVDFYRAKMLDDSGQLESARAMFDKVLIRNPSNGEAFIGRARVLVKLNQRKPAVADFRLGLELLREPKAEYFLELAKVLVTEKNPGDALCSLDAGIKKLGDVSLQVYALELELERQNHDAALARLGTIIERAERKENWLARRGDILLAAGRPAEAQKSFDSALAAIKLLPSVLQKAPPMQNLQSHIHTALGKTAAPSVTRN